MLKLTYKYVPCIYKPLEISGFARLCDYVSGYQDETCVRFRYFDNNKKKWFNYFCTEKEIKLN